MARDQIEVDLLLNAKKAEATIKQMNRELSKMGKTMGQAFSGGGGGAGNKVRALGTGLSKATVRADEFSKSLEASNARVIAFGASAGLIMNVDKALRAMVRTTIQVEKAMADVNVVMNVSNKQLEQFGKGMFKVAKDTAQGFSTVAEASTELARQGLGMEKTLARTKDALILTRLTGMNAADAVKSLTAAVNSFTKEGVTSAQVINRMAKVDAAFAVSSEDLAKAISRVGSSAVDAGVSMNELMAITTAVQQKTARGGAVIGNAFKTIFTRIQRSDVQSKLKGFGVATEDMSGKMLNGIQVIENLAKKFDTLTKSQQASLGESVAGVFQINILKAAMSDLATETSQYKRALDTANSATNEAYKRNEQLNKTLDSLVNRTLANLTQVGSALGGDIFGPALNNVLSTVNNVIEAFSEGGKFESFGEGIGKNLVKGIGKFIGGPGLIIATAVFAKLTLSLGKFAATAFKDIMGINNAVKQRVALEEIVVNTLASEPALLQKVKMGTLSVLDVEKQILATIKQQQAERAALKGYGGALAGSMYQRGTRVGSSGRAFSRGMGRMGRASGFVPNFADANGERAAAAAGGYTAGAIKTMNQPGAGTMMYNSAETVKQFPGMSQKAIMPPKNSPAGAGYKSAFGAAHGFNPYAAEGFIPNFNRAPKRPATRKPGTAGKGTQKVVDLALTMANKKNDVGIITQEGKSITPLTFTQNAMSEKKGIPKLRNALKELRGADGRVVGKASLGVSGVPIVPVFPFSDKNDRMSKAAKAGSAFNYLENRLTKYAKDLSQMMFGGTGNARKFNMNALGKGTEGDIFEEGVRAAIGGAKNEDRNSFFDFNGGSYAKSNLIGFFNARGAKKLGSKSKIEGKIGYESAKSGGIPNKMMNDDSVGLDYKEVLRQFKSQFTRKTKKSKALGYVPNFSPLSSSISRERQAGIPASKIRVGSSPALRSSGNPSGLGVYNTIDEPRGLNQGISRSRSMGINPKSHGAAEGFVPNFNIVQFGGKAVMAAAKKSGMLSKMGNMFGGMGGKLKGAGKNLGGTAGMIGGLTMSGSDLLGGYGGAMASGALMGIGGGPATMIGGAALGALGEFISRLGSSSEDATESIEKQTEAQKQASDAAKESALSFAQVAKSLSAADFVAEKEDQLRQIVATNPEMANTLEYSKLQTSTRGNFESNLDSFYKQAEKVKRFSSSVENFKVPTFTRTELVEDGYGNTLEKKVARKGNIKESKGQAEEMFKLLAAQGITPAARMDELVKSGMTLEQFKAGKGMAAMGGGAGALGINKSQFSKLTSKLKESFGPEGVQQFEAQVTKKFLSERAFTLAQAREAERQTKIDAERDVQEDKDLKARQALTGSRASTFSAVQGAVAARRASENRLASGMGVLNRRGASESLDLRLKASMNSATLFGEGLIKANSLIEKERILKEKNLAVDKINLQEKESIAKLTADAEKKFLTGLLSSDDIGSPERKAAEREIGILKQDPAAAAARRAQLESQTNLAADEKLILQFLRAQIEGEADARAKAKTSIEETGLAYDANKTAVDKNTKSQTDLFNESKKFQFQQAIEKLKFDANVAGATPEGLRRMQQGTAPGYEGQRFGITNREIADASREARMSSFRAGQGGMNSMATFKETFAYGGNDAILEFDDGVRTVAQNMKSSFADAFQSISSGATTVQGALANMAQSILSSINQMSTQMFTNMMFSKMFGGGMAKGGYVPGYATGGLVTGGSGHKDDVLTRMQGGEFVIKKSAVNKIGVSNLNAINGYANGGSTGPSMGRMGAISAVSGAATGILGAMMQDRPDKPLPSRNYGKGRGSLGYLGGADPDSGQIDRASGGGTSANVSLSKGFVYYRRDPKTGQLISERARPTEGRFEVSNALSLMGRLDENDSRTSRMFDKEQKLADYQNYVAGEKASRRAQIRAVKDQKKSRLIGAYMNAAMLVGGAKLFGGGPPAGTKVMTGSDGKLSSFAPDAYNPTFTGSEGFGGFKSSVSRIKDPFLNAGVSMNASGIPNMASGGRANGSLARVMGGEYIMSPETVRTHGVGFMTELNRGNLPKYASGGLVGNQTGGVASDGSGAGTAGNMTNNVSINVNIDKSGKAEASASVGSEDNSESSREESEDVQNNTGLGKALQSVVLDEIVKQQRPGGLLYTQN